MAAAVMMQDTFWSDKWRYVDAETAYQERLAGTGGASQVQTQSSSLVSEIAKAREQIKNTLKGDVSGGAVSSGNEANLVAQIQAVANENKELRKVTNDLQNLVKKLESRVAALEKSGAPGAAPAATPAKPVEDDDDDDDDDVDLFGSDSDDEPDEEAEKLKAERLAAYQAKKSKKPALIAKSSVLLDIKPWDDETDMAEMEKQVRTIEKDGLLWGASKLVPVGYGIKKLQIMMVIEDDKISVDDISDQICEFEDYVQSVDIAAFSKI